MIRPWISIIRFAFVVLYMERTIGESARDWKAIESIAEKHPYIVAILNSSKSYMCTGTIVGEKQVLTTGRCAKSDPRYVAVGVAIINAYTSKNNLFPITETVIHGDYVYSFNAKDPHLIQTHSNIGLICTEHSFLELYYERPDIGDYYASELRQKQFSVVGYGQLEGSSTFVLQTQWYRQSPCLNPKWYYCVCGYEYRTATPTYETEFGEGAPVLLGTEVVAVAAVPCGKLVVEISNTKYSIFTVIAPYKPWLVKPQTLDRISFRYQSFSRKADGSVNMKHSMYNICILLLISKVLF